MPAQNETAVKFSEKEVLENPFIYHSKKVLEKLEVEKTVKIEEVVNYTIRFGSSFNKKNKN